jgi:ribosomal protein S6--L-glutamate ligase
MIIRTTGVLQERYEDLGPADVFIGTLPPGRLRSAWGVDLLERGVRFIPSLLSQTLSRSKAAQAGLLNPWMVPPTRVIARRSDLLQAAGRFAQKGIGAVVTKQEGMHCGHGIRRWENVEAVYNALAFDASAYPFVLQPFLMGVIDLRVIVVGAYIEAYRRVNPNNFRSNLAAGGQSRAQALAPELEGFCRAVMQRGRFPYAHIDLLVAAESGACYLSEIALEGGITGARVARAELDRMKHEQIERLSGGRPPEA